jgi:hypothetical protein
MPIQTTKDKNFMTALKRVMEWGFYGNQAGMAQNAALMPFGNGEAMPVPNHNNTAPIPALAVSPADISYIPIPTLATYNVTLNAALGNTRFFIADTYYRVASIRFVYKTAGTSTSIAIQVTKDVQGTAPGLGTPLLATAFDGVNTVINTTTTGTLVSTQNTLLLNPGDTLSVSFTGTLTTIAGVLIEVELVNTCQCTSGATPAVLVQGQPLQIPPYVPGTSISPFGPIAPFGTTVPSNVAMYYVHRNTDLSTTPFFLANLDMTVTAVYAMIGTAFATGVTIDVTHDTGTNAPGAGNSVLSAAMSGTGTVNTLLIPTLTATASRLQLLAGDRLSVKYSATTTGADVAIVVVFAPIYDRLEQSFFLGPNAQQQVAQCFMIANRLYEVIDASCVYATAAGGAADLLVTIDKQTTVPGGGSGIQTDNTNAGFNMNTTTNTVQVATLNILRDRLLSPGDRLGLSPTGAAQSLANVCLTVSLRQHA